MEWPKEFIKIDPSIRECSNCYYIDDIGVDITICPKHSELFKDNLSEKSKWINVKEQLPEENKLIIIFDEGFGINIAFRRFSSIHYEWSSMWDENYQFFSEVTHWMPLPNKPEELENDQL